MEDFRNLGAPERLEVRIGVKWVSGIYRAKMQCTSGPRSVCPVLGAYVQYYYTAVQRLLRMSRY